MTAETTLRDAVAIHGRAYRLLRWLADAVERGFVRFDRAHEYATMDAVAAEWISRHYENIPPDCRPSESSGPAVERFARYFSTFLSTSFDLVADAGKVFKSHCGCYCNMCRYMASAPRLKIKKVSASHKRQAEKLKRHYLEKLLFEDGLADVDPEYLLQNGELSRNAAIVAYGAELLRRCEGYSYGTPVLALWRQFAWTVAGAPDRKFELTYEVIVDAQTTLLTAAKSARESGSVE